MGKWLSKIQYRLCKSYINLTSNTTQVGLTLDVTSRDIQPNFKIKNDFLISYSTNEMKYNKYSSLFTLQI